MAIAGIMVPVPTIVGLWLMLRACAVIDKITTVYVQSPVAAHCTRSWWLVFGHSRYRNVDPVERAKRLETSCSASDPSCTRSWVRSSFSSQEHPLVRQASASLMPEVPGSA